MFNRLLLLLIFALCINSAFAQATENTNTTFKRLYVGINTTQGVGYRYLVRNKSVAVPADEEDATNYVRDLRNQREVPEYVFDANIRVGCKITKNIEVETGVGYNRLGYFYKLHLDASPGEYIDMKRWDYFHYLNIPIVANFLVGQKKIQGLFSAGVSMNIYLKETYKSIFTENGRKIKQKGDVGYLINPLAQFNLSPLLSIGINYQITPLIGLRVMPTFQMQALKNVKGAPLTEYLYSGGINMAINFGFIDARAKEKK